MTTKLASNSPVTFVTQAFCHPLLSAVVLCKLTIVAQELQHLWINNKTMCLNYILSECDEYFFIVVWHCWQKQCTAVVRFLWLLTLFTEG